ncbi:phosphoribosylamine--glycine ligase [Ilumatobacter coccineus]|uniref:Multifunctional fusion protein n=1 Tax=Ilumatobacter coccineus (strain NBRC 103263 / KCTC 29153 / YM16-304) TaxID=1313172 RepID=A0A6C7E9I3_ILUCY|nr:phosphoribosylamine--glycine ligase [Ilumatobacter coccineus]BAN02682.1 phosphoribosylamine--glycine ligase/phosphoribosylformylglycinamidine cyclo-ligase [Ilumatobacter coccineus YM16-304]
MRVLVLGAGGREQAIAWACRRHGHDVRLAADLGDASPDDTDLVIPGPEAALVAGAADECARRGIPCFGPTAALAELEASKGFARDLATALDIPGPAYARFDPARSERVVDDAIAWWSALDRPVVVKLDGLAAGKGVTVPASDGETRAAIVDAAAAGPFVLEERISGPECSLLALCDGTTAVALPLAQDHKRIGEGDTGPNTGGMGAYAPAPVAHTADDLLATFVQPVVDHFAAAGTPYVGVIFAGLMSTGNGPRLIEYNVRFGDPEAQAVLPLLATDLAELALAAANGSIGDVPLTIDDRSAVTVVAAAAGYPGTPESGATITDRGDDGDAIRFDAGVTDGRTSGGRVLAVTGLGDDLAAARDAAYRRLAAIEFAGMQHRRDIAWRAPGAGFRSYAEAGVDIDEGARAVAEMKAAVESTHDVGSGRGVLHGVGSFGGVFSAKAITELDDPVLVASTDGVGTKVELAARLGRVRGVGADIVNHCIGDVLVQNARPLFFLDYIAASVLDADMVADVVTGMAEACRAANCAVLGGETAEMPGVYRDGAFDIAGTLIGVVDTADLLPRDDVSAGDTLIGVASSGPHTNGYSLLRKVFEWIPMDVVPDGMDRPLGDALLEPHRNYLDPLRGALESGKIKALAQITGGGLPENLPRVLPDGVAADIELGSWPVPPLFRLVRELTPQMSTDELYRTLNMGIGMVVVCAAADADAVQAAIPETTWRIGSLVAGERSVTLR